MVMKLLPKPRGKMPRKSVSGIEQEQKHRFHYIETKSNRSIGKKLVYNDFSKKLVRENPGIIKAIKFLEKNELEKRFIDPKGKFEILRITDFIKNKHTDILSRGTLTSSSYFIRINSEAQIYNFYLKEQRAHSTEELMLLNLIEKRSFEYGFNIIQPHLAFDNHDVFKKYILYDFTNKLTVDDAIKLSQISLTDKENIINKLDNFENILRNKYSIPISNFKAQNCFIDISKKPYQLYLFDPLYGSIRNRSSDPELKKLKKKIVNNN